MKKIILTKTVSREQSLFYSESKFFSNVYHVSKLFGECGKNAVYLVEPGNVQTSSWYDHNNIVRLFEWISYNTVHNPQFFDLIKKDFYRSWDMLYPYIQKRKNIKTLDDLKRFRSNIIDFYWPSSVVYALPNIPGINETYNKTAMKLREETQNEINSVNDVYLDFFNYKFPRYKQIANFLTAEEIFSLAKNEFSEIKLREIYKRKENGYFLFNNKLFPYHELNNILKKNNIELQDYHKAESNKTLNGQVAYRGKVMGIVKLVFSLSDISKVKKGDVIVTSMTMPKYLPALKKAGAFVTDEGGITCHAAILAREMKKPCIIGTKIATKVLKDGDLVEVDAEKGIVRIIK